MRIFWKFTVFENLISTPLGMIETSGSNSGLFQCWV